MTDVNVEFTVNTRETVLSLWSKYPFAITRFGWDKNKRCFLEISISEEMQLVASSYSLLIHREEGQGSLFTGGGNEAIEKISKDGLLFKGDVIQSKFAHSSVDLILYIHDASILAQLFEAVDEINANQYTVSTGGYALYML